MTTYQRLPVAFEYGKGAWLYDTQGVGYLDAISGLAVCSLGHAHPAVTEAVSRQSGKLLHTSNLYEIPLQERLAERLCEISSMHRVFFCNSGAEANEAAIKLCRKYAHQKGTSDPVIVVTSGSFHGRTIATLTATGNEKIKQGFAPLLAGFHRIPYNDLEALRGLQDAGLNIVAVMLEPVQGEGGVVVPEPGYLKAVRDICSANQWLMVLDEIQTGLCRTGEWFAWQHEQARPDIMTLAKSLGNGVPVGACLADAAAAEPMVPGSHGSTFGGNPLASAAGLAVLEIMTQEQLAGRARQLGARMLEQIKQALAGCDGVRAIRGMGMMFGIELERECRALVSMALRDHLLINVTAERVVRLLPPLIITDADADRLVTQVCALIKTFLEGKAE